MNKLKPYKLMLALIALLAGNIALAGEGQLLGVVPGNPLIDTSNDSTLTCSYDGATLNLQATAVSIELTPGGIVEVIFSDNTGAQMGGLLDITAQIDSGGNLTGGTMTVSGAYLQGGGVAGDPNPILTADLTDYGIIDGGATDQADFRGMVTGGDLTTNANWPGATDVGIVADLVNSAYDAATGFGNAWNCESMKATVGPIPPVVQQGCNLTIVKTAMPMTVASSGGHQSGNWGGYNNPHGHGMGGGDTDTDSDSGRDHNMNGDSDDSDSDSEADSADSGDSPMACGCKGRVKELTMRWNAPYPETVMVTQGNGTVLFAATLVQPGEEFTFPVMGRAIKLFANGEKVAKARTRCKFPIGPGKKFGNFEVVSGKSKWSMLPLCPIAGSTCGTENEVTYTYVVTNTGPGNANNVIINDDQLGVVDSFAANPALVTLASGASVTVSKTVCIFDTTINVADAIATDDNADACVFNPDADGDGVQDNTATVTEMNGGHTGPHYPGCGHQVGGMNMGFKKWGGWWHRKH